MTSHKRQEEICIDVYLCVNVPWRVVHIYEYIYIYIYIYIYDSCMRCKQRHSISLPWRTKIVQDMDWVNHAEKGYPGEKYPERKKPDMFSTALISVKAWCNPSRKYVLASLFDACTQQLLQQQPNSGSLLRTASSPHICEVIGQIASERL